ncbi:MAG: hypothetical protein AB1Z98_07925 [Nannocystaceae bacterium]
MKRTFLVLSLAALLPSIPACDVEVDEAHDSGRVDRVGSLGSKPYHGRWEGAITQVNGIVSNNYDATIVLTPSRCSRLNPGDVFTSEWDYYALGATCTSELTYLGATVQVAGGIHTWKFHDANTSGPCFDGLVSLEQTSDPNVLHYSWRYLDGTLDAEGDVSKNGLCTPGF